MKKSKTCCAPKSEKEGADNRNQLSRVNRIRGQVEGIGRLIDEKAYCPHILTQIQAARSALASLQAAILASHLEHCVRDGLRKNSEGEINNLVAELVSIFKNID